MTTTDNDRTARALEWLKGAAAIDNAYISRWDMAAWDQWARAATADPAGPCPSVPAWMQPLLEDWHTDFSLPQPSVAQLLPTGHDWFTESDTHPDLTLLVEGAEGEQAPTLAQVRQAWSRAVEGGVQPFVAMHVVPAVPWGVAVVGQIEAFYVAGEGTSVRELTNELDRILSVPSGAPVVPLDARTDHPAPLVRAWEWMYG